MDNLTVHYYRDCGSAGAGSLRVEAYAGEVNPDAVTEVCPGCGIVLEREQGPRHPYMTGSVACWRGFGELLAAQYADPARMRFHQLVVDSYAAQHPGGEDPRAVRSVGIHLMTLALFIDHGTDPALGTDLHRRMVTRPIFDHLDFRLVKPDARLTFQHVPLSGPPEIVGSLAFEWAESVWRAWSAHHATVGEWLATSERKSG